MSTPHAGPAVCQIDNCGVLAIRRCATCGRAFCPSHQARHHGGLHPDEDMCEECWKQSPSELEREALWEVMDYIDGRRSRLSRARQALLSAYLPTVALYETRLQTQGGIFGSKLVTQYVPAGRGWILGRFQGSFVRFLDGERSESYPKECIAAFRDIDNFKDNTGFLPGGVALVRPVEGPIQVGPERGGYFFIDGNVLDYPVIGQAIRTITGGASLP